jgi:hypothetical protein
MGVLARVRKVAVLVLLLAAMVPGSAVSAVDEECPNIGLCDDCGTPVGECLIPSNESCADPYGCTFTWRICSGPGYSYKICNCTDPCEGE